MIYALWDLGDLYGYSKSPALLIQKARDFESKYMDGRPIDWTYYDYHYPKYVGRIDGYEFWNIIPIFLEEDK